MRRTPGFTLAEALVALAITVLIAGALLSIAVPSARGFRTQPASLDVQQRLRLGADTLRDAILSAGSGVVHQDEDGGLPLGTIVPCVLPYRVGLRRPDAPGAFHADVLTLISMAVGIAGARIDAAFQGESGTLGVVAGPGCPAGRPACGIDAGSTLLLLDASGQADLYGVSAVLGDRLTVRARGPCTGRRYAAGARLVPLEIASYSLRAATGPDGPQLMRYDGNQSELPQLDHVVGFALEYWGDPRPPSLRAPPGGAERTPTYGPAPPAAGEDDPRDTWGAGENCTIAVSAGYQVPRLPDSGGEALVPLSQAMLTDGPWCPDAASSPRFDADLLRIRRVRVTLRLEAWLDALRGSDPRFFHRPGASRRPDVVPDSEFAFDAVPRSPGGGR